MLARIIIFIFKNYPISRKIFFEHFFVWLCEIKCDFDHILIRNSLMLSRVTTKSHFIKLEKLLNCIFSFYFLKINSSLLKISIIPNIVWLIRFLCVTWWLRKPRWRFWSYWILFRSNFSSFRRFFRSYFPSFRWFFRSNFSSFRRFFRSNFSSFRWFFRSYYFSFWWFFRSNFVRFNYFFRAYIFLLFLEWIFCFLYFLRYLLLLFNLNWFFRPYIRKLAIFFGSNFTLFWSYQRPQFLNFG
jgi:hypothetical protein